MQAAKQLADAVIPNEYGIDPSGKLRIGSKICTNLLGKVLADLGNMRDESIATAVRCRAPFPHALAQCLSSWCWWALLAWRLAFPST